MGCVSYNDQIDRILADAKQAPLPAWDDGFRPKPIAELQLMTQEELAFEAAESCRRIVLYRKHNAIFMVPQRYRYLDQIKLVARSKNGGIDPTWTHEIVKGTLAARNLQTGAQFEAAMRQCSDAGLKARI